jgi:soluble lytic murein transglycosylase-like protein
MKFHYRAETYAIAERHGLDHELVIAIAMVESSGRTYAYRYEPGFWMRYLAGKREWDGSNPERVSASYGLMQVMFPVAIECGYPKGDPPEYLFVPIVGIEFGCRKLRELLTWAKGDQAAALAAYNGGKKGNAPSASPKRNHEYVAKVRFTLDQVKAGGYVA